MTGDVARGHNDECRARIEAAMRADPEMQQRTEAADARLARGAQERRKALRKEGPEVVGDPEAQRVDPRAASQREAPRAEENPTREEVERANEEVRAQQARLFMGKHGAKHSSRTSTCEKSR